MKIKSKLQFPIALAIMSFAIFSMIFQGCENGYTEDIFNDLKLKSESVSPTSEFRVFNKTYETTNDEVIWKAQLNKIIENNVLLEQNELKIESYKYVKRVDDIEELVQIKSEIINKNILLPIYESNSELFVITENKISKDRFAHFLDYLMPTSENTKIINDESSLSTNAVYLFERNDLSIVNLKWVYKGKILYTTCLVSDKRGIVYDNFLYFIRIVVEKVKIIKNNPTNSINASTIIPRLKTTTIEPPIDISYGNMWANAGYNILGARLWEYHVESYVSGYMFNSIKYITDKFLTATHYESPLYGCDADIRQISFETGANGHLDYAFGYCYSFLGNATVAWDGFSFSIGSSTGAVGIDYVIPEELN